MNRHATLNRFYRLVWSDRLAAYVAVAETAKGRGKRTVRAGALAAVFMAAVGVCEQAELRHRTFLGIWKDNSWGDAESRSGSGSSLAATLALRAWLPKTLHALGVRILVDAGCGDFNWMKGLTGSLKYYFGYDIVPELVDDVRSRFKDEINCSFLEADIVAASLAQGDAILCRDCLSHLVPDAALLALKSFRRSGARLLLATTHRSGQNAWINTGGWYPMDLTAPPFKLPPPLFSFAEDATKTIGVWSMVDLPG